MSIILADIGGTHARFARLEGDHFTAPIKLPVSDYPSLSAALNEYSDQKSALYIATAAWPYPDQTWRFARPDRWIINPHELSSEGWEIKYIGNDFGASALGALRLKGEQLYTVQDKIAHEITQHRIAVLGSGTGLGLAYVADGAVHETYGGHMEAPQITDEHQTITRLIKRLKDNERPVSAEEIISGPGLYLLYQALCMLHGARLEINKPEDLFSNKDHPVVRRAIDVYHEFLGVFSHQAVIYSHSYAGLYLDGGLIHQLLEHNLFNHELFLEYFIGDPLPLIKEQMSAMSVHIVNEPFAALYGLLEIIEHGK